MKITLEINKTVGSQNILPNYEWKGKLEHGTLTSFARAFTPQEVVNQLLSAYVIEKTI